MSNVVEIGTGSSFRSVIINRPEVNNALNGQVFVELVEAFETLAKEGTKVVVLRGQPIPGKSKSTSAGADLSTLVRKDDDGYKPLDLDAALVHMDEGLKAIEEIVKIRNEAGMLVIGGIEGGEDGKEKGYLLAGALEVFAAVCEIIIVSENTILGFPEYDLDGAPGWGGPHQTHRLTGWNPQRTAWLLLGNKIDGITAERWGIVTRAVAPGTVFDTINKLADKVVARSPLATRYALMLARAPLGQNVTEQAKHFMAHLMMQPEGWVKSVGAFLDRSKK
ncbi:MAG: enoyl-CoA hydratase/isomerase family protein [bacterium]